MIVISRPALFFIKCSFSGQCVLTKLTSMVSSYFKDSGLVLIIFTLGAHLPDISSEVGFFDVLYLGIFAILSPAFEIRFYRDEKPERSLVAEIACAVAHFFSILSTFKQRFIVLLAGVPVNHRYIVDRMLAEFAAATVVMAEAVPGKKQVSNSALTASLEGILQTSYPTTFSYYSRCLERKHSHFLWTGPKLQIVARSEAVASLIPIIAMGERLDSPTQPIYDIILDSELDSAPPSTPAAGEKRNASGDSEGSPDRPLKSRKIC